MKLLIEALRVWKPPTTKRPLKHETSVQRGTGSNLSTRPNVINEEYRELGLISIREEGTSPVPSTLAQKTEEIVAVEPGQHSSGIQSPHHASPSSGKVEHDSPEDDNDSLCSNAGSRQSFLKYSEDMPKD